MGWATRASKTAARRAGGDAQDPERSTSFGLKHAGAYESVHHGALSQGEVHQVSELLADLGQLAVPG